MTTQPTQHRQLAPLFLTIALALSLHPGASSAGEQLQPTAPMAVARRGHTATVLADGRVLIAGGLDASGPLTAAEIFDPALKTFTLAGNLANARYGHTATLLANGRVLIAGGQDAVGPVDSAEIFDPASATPFRLLAASMGAARAGHTATLRSDGTVLLAGGDSAGTAEVFDPSTESFYTPLMHMAGPRFGHTATPLAEDNVFMVGGGTTSIELFNAASNSFSLWPVGLSQIRSGHSSIPTTSGQLLVIGGDQTGSFELFDPVNGSSPLSLSLGAPSSTANLLANNKILVLGSGVSGLFDETTSELSPLSGTNASSLQLAGHTATELPTANKQILVAGGIDSSNNLVSSATLYNPAVIATDAGDYPPFSWVNITGEGFLPNEIVTNQVQEIVGPAAGTNFAPWGVTADTNGAFATLWQVFSDELLDTTLKLTAVGQSSGLKAEAIFTDATSVKTVTVGPQVGSLTYGTGGSVTYNVAITSNGSGSSGTITPTASGLPAGASASFSPAAFVLNGNNTNLTLTITTTAATPAGVTTITATAQGNSGNGTLTVNQRALTVTAATNNKTYDGTTGATATPTITSGTLAAGDTPTLAETYATKAVGTGKTLTPTATIKNSINVDVTASYNITFVNNTTGVITTRPLTVSATGVNKTYDGTATATVTLSDNRVAGDTITDNNTSASFADKNVGTGKTVTVSGISISGTDAGNYALQNTSATTTANITARALAVSATGVNRVYDGTTAATVTLSDNRVAGDVFADSFTTATFATKTVANGKTVSVSGISISGTDAGNYTFNTTASTTANITAFALTITATGVNKVYNANTTATVTLSDNRIAGDLFTDSSTTATFANKNVGTGKTVSVAGISISGTDAPNYTFNTTATTTADITAATLTVSGITANNKAYDGNTTAALNTGSAALVGKLGSDVVTLNVGSATGTFLDKAVGTGKTVTVSGLTISGTDSGNYTLTQPTTTANITAKALTVSGITANNKVYDATLAATLNLGSAALVGVVGIDDVTLNSGSASGAFATKTVGTGKIVTVSGLTISGTDSGNYTLTQPTTTANITAATLTVTGITANNKVYDGNTTATLNTGSAALVGKLGSDVVNLSTVGGIGTFASKAVGTSKTVTVSGLTISGTDSANYTLTQPTTTADITAKNLNVSGITAVNKIYDGNTTTTLNFGSAALVGVVSGDTVTLNSGAAVGSFATKTVGTAKAVNVSGLTIAGTDAGNYTLTQPTTTANITAKGLTVSGVTANDKVYDATTAATLNTASAALVGAVSGDDVTLNTGGATGAFSDKNVGVGKTVTASGLTITGADSGNYSLTQPITTASISALGITGSVTANNKVYDGTTAATIATRSLIGVIGGDSVTYTGGTATFADKNVGTGKTVTATGLSLTGTDAGNYTVNSTTATTANITARALVVTATGVNKVYDATTSATVTLTDNRLSGDVFTDSYTTAALNDKNVGTGKTVSVSGISISGLDAGNYTFNTTATASANITPLGLTVTATGVNKVYDRTTAATVTLADNRISGDVVTDNFSSATFANKTVGTGKPISVSGISITGADAGNYTLQNTTAATSADITQRPLTVTATGVNKVYDGTATATVNLSDNMIAGDIVGETSNSPSFADKNVGTGKPVTVTGILLNGADAANYSLQNTTASTTANITGRALIVTATALDKVYDTTTAAGVTLSDNRISGDVFTDSFTSAAFVTASAGNGITVNVTGISISGTDAGNYTANTTAATTANITPATVTAIPTVNNKVYDGNTTATPAFAAASAAFIGVLGSDHINLAQDAGSTATFSDRNVGTGKTVTVTNLKITGPDLGSYVLASTTATSTADITSRPLSITAVSNTKTYDGNTSAAAIPTVSGLQDADTATGLSEAYANRNAGTGKTLIPSGTVIDSITSLPSGNYTVSFVNNTTGVINKAALTITAATNTKGYDSTTSAAATPTVAGLKDGDTVTGLVETYDTKNSGTGKTLTVSAGFTVNDLNSGNNYTVSLVANTTGVITASILTVSATGVNKVYDGTTTATVTLSDNRVSGDVFTVSYTSATFADKNVGTGKTVTVSGISISGPDAGNYSVNTTATTTANITARALTVSAAGVDKVYDGTTAATVNLSDNRVSGDVFTDSYTSATFADKNVGTGKAVSVTGISISGTDAGNYTFNTTASTTANITARALAISATGVNKVHDGNTTATVTLSDNRVSGDVFTDSYTSASFANKNVGTGKTVSVSGISISGTDAGNYTFNTTTSTTANITQRALAVSATGINKVYDGTTAATVTLSDDKVSGDDVTPSYTTAAFDTKNVGTGKTVSVSGISISGADAGNYTFNTTTSTTANITQRALTVSATGINKVYNSTTAATVTLSDDKVSGDDVTPSYTTAAFDTKNVGTGKTVSVSGISISGADAGNYTFNTTTSTTANITQRALTVSATGINKVYNSTTAATVTLSDDKVSGDDVTPSYTTAAFDTKNVGTGKTVSVSGISISGADAGNYTFNMTASTTANITQRALAVSATGINKVYDSTTAATVTLSDDKVSGDDVTPSYTSAAFDTKNVGTGKTVSVSGISISGADAGNYTFNTTTSTTANITQRALAVSATGINKVYDSTTAATVTLSDDKVSGDDVTPSYTTAAFDTKNVGTGKTVSVSGISISGADAGNYTFNTTTSTTADITPFGLTVSAHGVNKVYDSTTAATVTLSDDRFSGDVFSDTYTSAAFNNKNVDTGKPVSASGISISGADAANYTFNTTANTTADITPFGLTVSAHGVNKVYDSTTAATVTLSDDRFSGDVFSDSYTSAAFNNKNVGIGKPVSVSGISISGADAANYTFNTTANTTADITPFGLTVSAHGVNKVYDSTTAATVTLSDDRFSGDVFSDSYTSASFADKNVGTGKPVSASGISISGTDAGNYTFNTTANTTADITPFGLTVNAHGVNKVYDSTTAATVTLSDDRFSGDVFSDSYTSAAFNNKNVGTGKPVSVSGISISGTDAGNYTFNTTANTTADIAPFGLTVSAHGVNKVYDSTTAATVTLSDDRFSGDVFSDSYTSASFADKNVGIGKPVSVSGISISSADAANYTFNTTANTTADITPFGLTVSAHGVNKVYDSTTAATVTLSDDRFSGDVFSDSYTSAAFNNKNVGTGKPVSASGISISGTDAGNYTFNTTANTTADITAFGLTVSAHGVNKVYDSTTAATVTLSDDRFSGDVFSDSYTSAAFNNKNVGTGKPVSASGISISGTDAGNYTFNTTANTTADITPFGLTVSAHGVNKVYDSTTAATVTLSDDRFSGDVFSDSYTSAAFNNKNVGTGKPVSASGISISGADAANYSFNTTANTTADITPFGLTVSAHGVNKVYDSTTAATVTLSDDRFSGDVFSDSYTSAAFNNKNVGTGKPVSASGISISGTDAGNYTFNTTANTTADITPFGLTVNAHGVNKVYDSTTAATVTLSDDRFSGDVFSDSYTSAAFNNKNVGTGKPVSVSGISISGTDAGNYTFNTTANTTADITPFGLTVSAHGVNKVYDSTTAATVTLSDDRFSGDVFSDSYTSASFADKNVGIGKPVSVSGISISGADAANYTFNTTANTTADITPFGLTVSAHGVNKVYDSTTAATVTLSDDRFSGDVFSDSYTSAAFNNKNVGTGKPVSASGISISGTDAGNYTFNTTASTTADITAFGLTVSAHGVNKVYDSTTAATVTLSDDRFSGDVFSDSYTSAAFNNKNVGTGKPVSASGISISGTDAGNYTFNTTASTTADITAFGLTVSAHGVNKVYDSTTAATVTLSDDRFSGDVFSDSYTSAAFNNKNVGTGKPVSASGISISGADAANYSFNTTANTTADITPFGLTVSAHGVNKVYDSTTAATVTLSDDRFSGDVFSDSYTSASFADKNVGTGKPVSVSGISISGTDAGNYTFNTTASTMANITARALIISATGVNKVYDGGTTATVTLSDNRVLGDVFSDAYASASFANKDVGNNKPVSVLGISISGTDAGNYTFNTTAATTANITPATLTITANPQTKVYGKVDPPLTYGVGGLQGSDTASIVLTGGLSRAAGETVMGSPYAINQGTLLVANANYTIAFTGSTLTITKAQTGTAVASSAVLIVFGSNITFTATVTDTTPLSIGTPTGTVTFKDGATSIGTGTLNVSGVASMSISSLAAGSHTITVVYAGDNNFTGSTSPNLTETVLASVTVTFLPPLAGQPVGNKINVGQVVPHKVDLVNSLGQTVSSGVTVQLVVQGINLSNDSVFQDVPEDANGVGTDGTLTGPGLMAYTGGHWQFNLDTGNFTDPNTLAEANRCYVSTVKVIDNATSLLLGSTAINLETKK